MRTLLLSLCLGFSLTACCTTTPDTTDPAPPSKESLVSAPKTTKQKPPCKDDDEVCFVDRLGKANFGWLKEGTKAKVVLEKLGQPETKGERFEEGATGDIIETWTWKQKGIDLTANAPNMKDPVQNVSRITITAPCKLKTDRGVGIGSTEAEVRKAYAGTYPPLFDKPGKSLVAGSIYGGVFFDFENGKVIRIFIGAGAE